MNPEIEPELDHGVAEPDPWSLTDADTFSFRCHNLPEPQAPEPAVQIVGEAMGLVEVLHAAAL